MHHILPYLGNVSFLIGISVQQNLLDSSSNLDPTSLHFTSLIVTNECDWLNSEFNRSDRVFPKCT